MYSPAAARQTHDLPGVMPVEQEFEPSTVGRVAVLCDRSAIARCKPVEQELDPTVPDLFRISS